MEYWFAIGKSQGHWKVIGPFTDESAINSLAMEKFDDPQFITKSFPYRDEQRATNALKMELSTKFGISFAEAGKPVKHDRTKIEN